ncbi:MAG: homogentisate 1,2-dioxygenase [Cyanobacteria bacterium TGS_CYA1]|nr:homogentisate 1,2-dioxygenase [Cyanobacteria bacterium TGS_CYA1]
MTLSQKKESSPKSAKSDVDLKYLAGFGNHHHSEALPGALPIGQNSPQKAPYDLYAEQLNGASFLAARHENLRSWLYRIRPSVVHGQYEPYSLENFLSRPFDRTNLSPAQLRWDPLPESKDSLTFLQGIVTVAGNGADASVRGSAIHLYSFSQSMDKQYFTNSDGEMLIVPQTGSLHIRTEFGALTLGPWELAVIPRGIKFAVDLENSASSDIARGYILENYGPPLRLPYLGPIGSNGLANPRDFLAPVAAYKDEVGDFELITKFEGKFFKSNTKHNPCDVVAWHGNYYPYKYDTRYFCAINSVSFDHPDPSIFTVLTSPSELPGVSNIDFVIFPPRWMVAENSFRPPYYHRNIMSEYMGLVEGVYDAKEGGKGGFVPGGGSLHNCMTAHGPDSETFEKASETSLTPVKLENTLAFMFESSLVYVPTPAALDAAFLQGNYQNCWANLKSHFNKIKK